MHFTFLWLTTLSVFPHIYYPIIHSNRLRLENRFCMPIFIEILSRLHQFGPFFHMHLLKISFHCMIRCWVVDTVGWRLLKQEIQNIYLPLTSYSFCAWEYIVHLMASIVANHIFRVFIHFFLTPWLLKNPTTFRIKIRSHR